MIKRLKLFTLSLAFFWVYSLNAHVHPTPGAWQITGEFLYLLPSVDDTYFVIDSVGDTAVPIGTRVNNDFDFHPGFRVGGTYAFCDCNREMQIFYTRLRAVESKTISGDFLWAAVGFPDFANFYQVYSGTASSDLDLLYQRVDGLLAQEVLCVCGLDIYLNVGIEFAYLRLDEQYVFTDSSGPGFVDLKSKSWGIGPQLGAQFNYDLCTCMHFLPGTLGVAFTTSGSLLTSKTKEEFINPIPDLDGGEVDDDSTWRIIPAFHARVGLTYAMNPCSCLTAHLEIGYEFSTYLRGLTRIAVPDDGGAGLCYTNYYNFDIQGLYVAANIAF